MLGSSYDHTDESIMGFKAGDKTVAGGPASVGRFCEYVAGRCSGAVTAVILHVAYTQASRDGKSRRPMTCTFIMSGIIWHVAVFTLNGPD